VPQAVAWSQGGLINIKFWAVETKNL